MGEMMPVDKYHWDLEHILNGKTIDALYQEVVDVRKTILKMYPKFTDNLANFKKWISLGEQLEILSNRVSNYISNNYNEDLTNPKWIAWEQRLSVEGNAFSVQLSGLSNKIIKDEFKIKKYLKDKSTIEHQRHYELSFRNKPHILPDAEQKVLSTMGIINGGFSTIFSTLNDGEIKFEDAVDSKNKKIPLNTISNVMINLKHQDRAIRKSTWISFNKAYHNYENTLTQLLYHNYLMLNTSSKLHKFPDYIHATAFNDEIDVKLITSLYENVVLFKPTIKKYKKVVEPLLKHQLKINKLEPWDRTVELSKTQHQYTIEQTKDIVLKALAPLGDEYISNVKKAFNEHWISWLSKPGKQQGAYSIGETKGLDKYYISMNFDQSIRSISTIAHELGHSMNSLYINKKQKVYADVSIFYAEISSIVNETLLAYYLLDYYRDDLDMKKMILDELISNFIATTTRQVIFSNAEYVLNNFVNEGKPFTKESVKQVYEEMIEKYQGIDKDLKSKIKNEPYSYMLSTILRIPHFYAGNFYVYKYAIGQIVAVIVANKIFHGDKIMKHNYYRFLSSGDSLSPIDTIKLLGVDLYDAKTYIQAKTALDDWVNQLEKFIV